MSWEDLANAMDRMQPNWSVAYADEQDLKDYALITMQPDVDRFRRATEMLRSRVSRRLFEVVRAAVHAGLVKEVVK